MTDDIILYLQSYFQKCHLYQSSSSKSIGGPSLLLKIKHSLWKWVFLFFSVGVQSFLWSGSKVMFLTALSHTPCHVLLSLPAGLLPHCFIFLFRAAITAGNCIIRVIDASWLFPNCWFFFFLCFSSLNTAMKDIRNQLVQWFRILASHWNMESWGRGRWDLFDQGITCIQEMLQITDVSPVIRTLDVQNTLM